MNDLWVFLTDRDWKTWLGHFVAGVLITLILRVFLTVPLTPAQATVLAVFVAFLYREADNWIQYKRDLGYRMVQIRSTLDPADEGEPVKVTVRPLRRRDGPKVIDGFIDLWAPVLGSVLANVGVDALTSLL